MNIVTRGLGASQAIVSMGYGGTAALFYAVTNLIITRGLGTSQKIATRGYALATSAPAVEKIMSTITSTLGGAWAGAGDILGRLR